MEPVTCPRMEHTLSSRQPQTGGVTLQQVFDIHQWGTQGEDPLTLSHTHTHTQSHTRMHRQWLSSSSSERAHYILSPSSHQGPDHTVGRRPAAGGHVLACSRVRRGNAGGFISSSSSQLPRPDISWWCYCLASALLSCPFLSTTARWKGLLSREGCGVKARGGAGGCLDKQGTLPAPRKSVANIKQNRSKRREIV